MNKFFYLLLSFLFVAGIPYSNSSGYPDVPVEVQKRADLMIANAERASDSVFESQYDIIEKESLNGKPYIPWAQRPDDLPQADIPAFPGAYGGGEYSFGGRGGKVITVTNTNDSGPGSLRAACRTAGARIIVFNVAGLIMLKTPIIIKAPYVTIAGQTAPGDGVCIAGESFWISTHDVVIRYMRFRRGITDVGRRDDACGGDPVGNIMIDHCSCSWGLDETISIYRHMYFPEKGSKGEKYPSVNVTIQNTIAAQGLDTYNHAFGSTLGGENCSFLRNLWADNTGRNPSIGWNGIFTFTNNVIYNWYHRTLDGGDYTTLYNIINNYFKPGPVTPKNKPVAHRILKPQTRKIVNGRKIYGRAYVNGNIVEGCPEVSKDNWNGGVQIEDLPDAGEYATAIKWNKPFPIKNKYPVMDARSAYYNVLKNAGANIPKRDIVDKRIIHQVETDEVYYAKGLNPDDFYQFESRALPRDAYKKGIITDIKQVGGYPEYKGNPYKDTDGDGMPDEWEIKYGLDPQDPSDANGDISGDGYTNIEKYINGIDPLMKVDWTKPENNFDTLEKKGSL